MKTLKHLEKKKFVWFLIGVSTVFFLLRLPSLIEPNWYGDEGVYQVISLAIQHGRALYADIWDNKPPLLYLTYTLFSGDQFSIRLLSAFFGITAAIVFFFLARALLKSDKAAGVSVILFTLLFATPFLEGNIANAENFMLLFVITAAFLIYTKSNTFNKPFAINHKLIIAGFLLGIAFLYKIVALFDFAAFCLYLLLTSPLRQIMPIRRKPNLLQHELTNILKWFQKEGIVFMLSFLFPIILAFLYFTLRGTLLPFIQSAFLGNIGYVGYANHFIIPQGLLLLKLILFITAITFIVLKQNQFSKPVLFISLWFVFTVFSAFFSQRQYTHYILVMLPTTCLLAGLFISHKLPIAKMRIGLLLIVIMFTAQNYFHSYGFGKTAHYYQNAISFLAGKKTVNDYQAFFDPETPRDYELASFITSKTSENDQIFLWGDSPQIYYLAKKLPPNKYTVSYHIIQDPQGIEDTQSAIDKIQPKFIITLSEAPPLPFQLPHYVGKYGIKGSAIYERTF